MDFGDGLDPLLRNMLGYEQGTPWKRLAREGDEGDVRSLFIPATHCAGRELVRQSAITLLLMRAFDADIDASAWTAYYYKTSLSGKLVGVIYGIHGGGAPQFMNVGANDERVKGEWEREKTFWLEHLPRDE